MIKLFIVLTFMFIIALSIWGITPEYEKCYSEMEYQGYAAFGCCCGLAGGTKETVYLSETCFSCPHLVLDCKYLKTKDVKKV